MEKKPYKLGIIVGRFQTFHKGHEYMIGSALALCERTGLFIGSSQESRTNKNPFTYEEREKILRTVFGDRLEIRPLPDIFAGNTVEWGKYVLSQAESCFGEKPELLVSGKEERRINWFDDAGEIQLAELYVPKIVDVSATLLREMLIEDREAEWKQYTPEVLWGMYGDMRNAVLASAENYDSHSI